MRSHKKKIKWAPRVSISRIFCFNSTCSSTYNGKLKLHDQKLQLRDTVAYGVFVALYCSMYFFLYHDMRKRRTYKVWEETSAIQNIQDTDKHSVYIITLANTPTLI